MIHVFHEWREAWEVNSYSCDGRYARIQIYERCAHCGTRGRDLQVRTAAVNLAPDPDKADPSRLVLQP